MIKAGADFNPLLPNELVTASATAGLFEPNWIAGVNPGTTGLAFGMYSFSVPDYDRGDYFVYSWNAEPADPAEVYFGLANWGKNRWDWFIGSASHRVDLPSIDPYFDGTGNLIITVLKLGTEASELKRLHLGNLAPVVSLSSSASFGFVPRLMDFDASGSSDADGSLVKFEWDPEGDGSFDQDTGSSPLFSQQYNDPGLFEPAVRVTDDDGVSATASLELRLTAGLQESVGRPNLAEEARAIVTCPDGSLFIVGSCSTGLGGDFGLVLKLETDGTVDFAKSWSGTGEVDPDENLIDAVLGADGFIYVCGETQTAEASKDGLLQKWTQDGELIWSRSCGGPSGESFSGVASLDGFVYACGSTTVATFGRALLVQYDTDGNFIWAVAQDEGLLSRFNSIAVQHAPSGLGQRVHCCGTYVPVSGEQDWLYVMFNETKLGLLGRRLGETGVVHNGDATAICLIGANPDQGTPLLAGTYSHGSPSNGLLGYVEGSLVSMSISGASSVSTNEMLALGEDGVRLFAGIGGSPDSALLAEFSSVLALGSGLLETVGDEESLEAEGLDLYDGGTALVGTVEGNLPTSAGFLPDTGGSSAGWIALTPSFPDAVVSAGETSTDTQDLSSQFELNLHQQDDDIYVELIPPK